MGPYAFPCAVALVLTLTLVLPTLKVWRRYGTWPVVFRREADSFQRLMGAATGTLFAGVILWAGLCAALDPVDLGIFPVPVVVTIVGWTCVGFGALIVVVAQIHMGASWRIGIDDRPTELVTGGLFRLVRNPIFSGLLLSLIGFVLITPASWTLMGFAGIFVLIALQTRLEEQHLIKLHGESYRGYAARVGRFVPLVGRLVSASSAETVDSENVARGLR